MSDSKAYAARCGGRKAARTLTGSVMAAAVGLFVSSSVLPSCAVDQKQEVATYRAVIDKDMAAPATPGADDVWTLEQALLITNKLNEQLSIQGEDYLQALIDKRRAFAAFLPTASAGASESYSHNRGGNTRNFTTSSANGSMNLFNGFQDVANLKRAAATIEQRRALLLDLQQSLLLSVAQTYYQVLRAEESSRVLENSLALRHEQVRDMQARQQGGLARPLDLAQAQADESATRVSLLQAQSDARNARTTLAFLVGVPSIKGELKDDFNAPAKSPTATEYEGLALAKRQDLIAAQQAVNAARFSVDQAMGAYYPSLSLSTSYLLYANPASALLWSAAFSGDVPLDISGTIRADVRNAWSRYRQSVLSLSLLQRQVHEQVETDIENMIISDEKITELRVGVQAAQRAFDLADHSYRLGNATNLDRLTAQNTLLSAKLQLTSEQFNQKVFFLDALRVTNQLVEKVAQGK